MADVSMEQVRLIDSEELPEEDSLTTVYPNGEHPPVCSGPTRSTQLHEIFDPLDVKYWHCCMHLYKWNIIIIVAEGFGSIIGLLRIILGFATGGIAEALIFAVLSFFGVSIWIWQISNCFKLKLRPVTGHCILLACLFFYFFILSTFCAVAAVTNSNWFQYILLHPGPKNCTETITECELKQLEERKQFFMIRFFIEIFTTGIFAWTLFITSKYRLFLVDLNKYCKDFRQILKTESAVQCTIDRIRDQIAGGYQPIRAKDWNPYEKKYYIRLGCLYTHSKYMIAGCTIIDFFVASIFALSVLITNTTESDKFFTTGIYVLSPSLFIVDFFLLNSYRYKTTIFMIPRFLHQIILAVFTIVNFFKFVTVGCWMFARNPFCEHPDFLMALLQYLAFAVAAFMQFYSTVTLLRFYHFMKDHQKYGVLKESFWDGDELLSEYALIDEDSKTAIQH